MHFYTASVESWQWTQRKYYIFMTQHMKICLFYSTQVLSFYPKIFPVTLPEKIRNGATPKWLKASCVAFTFCSLPSIRTQRDTRKFGVAFVLRRPLRIVRNARAHERQGLQVDVATWRQIWVVTGASIATFLKKAFCDRSVRCSFQKHWNERSDFLHSSIKIFGFT